MLVGGRKVLRTSWNVTWCVAQVLFGLLLTVGLLTALVNGQWGKVAWGFVPAFILFWWGVTGWYWWVSGVVVEDAGLTVRGLNRSRQIGWNEITSVQIAGGPMWTMPMGGCVPHLALGDGATQTLWQLSGGCDRALARHVEEIDTWRVTYS